MADAFVTDTHALLWHFTGASAKLGRHARRAFERVESGRARVLVPVVALVEVLDAVGKGRLSLEGGFAEWTARLRAHPGYEIANLTADVVLRSADLLSVPDRADRLIAATALAHKLPLITRDPALHDAGVQVVW